MAGIEKKTRKPDSKRVRKKKKGNVAQFFGANPSEVDGMKFQKKVRAEWD